MQYVARQPIVDSERRLAGFELLFRNSEENRCTESDPEIASRKVVDTAILLGMAEIADGHSLFLNCTHSLIVNKFPTLFDPCSTVVEVLESVRVDSALINACRDLRHAGYRIALDDFVPQPGLEPLIELADVLKIDVRCTTRAEWENLVKKYASPDKELLAEKVETEEEFSITKALGFTLFQGYFFSKPNVLSTRSINALHPSQLRILRLLSQPVLKFDEVEDFIKSDPAICYRLLRLLNSPVFGFRSSIHSILEGLTLLGESEVRKWLLLCTVLGVSPSKKHLLEMSLLRAKFAESIAETANLPQSELFLLGMLSLMDAILDLPIGTVATQLAVSNEIRGALAEEPNHLRDCFELVLSYERANWDRCDELRTQWNITPQTLSHAYTQAAVWAHRVHTVS